MTTLSLQETWIAEILNDPRKFIIPFVGLLILYALVNKINIDRRERGKLILMPVVTFVYCVLAIVAGTWFYEKYNWEIIWNILAKVGNSFLRTKGLKAFIHSYLGGEIVYLNLFLMLMYLPVKIIARKIMKKAMQSQAAMQVYAVDYYRFSVEHARWFLRPQWRGFQRFVSLAAKASIVLSAAVLCFSWAYEVHSEIIFVIFPFVVILLMQEVSNALNGMTQEEYENEITGDDVMLSGRIGNYQKLMDIYERLLSNTLITSYRSTDYTPKDGPENYLEELKTSEIQVDQLAAHYFEQQRREGVSLDVDYMHGTVELLHRNSVIFSNPFYRDMSKYLLLPLVDALIKGKNCLFLVGERDIAPDTAAWINEMLEDYARVSGIWRVQQLSRLKPECEIGILDFPSLYDVNIQERNREFFQNVAVCVLIESSNMIPTAQVGLSITVKEMNRQEVPPIYCIIDRTSDGLVDTFSHVLQTEITHVIAPPIPRCVYTSAVWDADGDYQRQKWFKKQTRFLGNAVELGAIALKNQIPKVTWFGGRKAPVRDVEWIAGQYYSQIAEYTHMVKQQSSIQQRFKFEPNFWQAETEDERFIIVEDQYCNMFETLRMFLSRGEHQSFVNVLSESYLLRDYMQYNKQLFISDPKAIPSILPDYARTERNVTLQLIMRMAIAPMPRHEIAAELMLIDQSVESVGKSLLSLIHKYTLAQENDVISIENKVVDPDSPTSDMEAYYYIRPGIFNKYFKNTLKNAYYVTEEAKFESEYVDAKMYGLLTQCVLPGQFLCVNGKYYQAEKINPDYGVLLQRASDRYDQRNSYRQIRRYVFPEDSYRFYPVSQRKVMDIEIAKERWNFRVVTEGYLKMRSYHDLKTAQVIDYSNDSVYAKLSMENVDFAHEPSRHPMERAYHNKNVLRIYLPDTDKDMRMTLAMLMQELFKTLYPDNWQYLAVLCDKPEDLSGMLSYMTYDVENFPKYASVSEEAEMLDEILEEAEKSIQEADNNQNEEASDDENADAASEAVEDEKTEAEEQIAEATEAVKRNVEEAVKKVSASEDDNKYTGGNIYIIEDSDIDLGLLESIDHNILRILEILDDYLEWHFEQIRVSQSVDPVAKRELSEEERKKAVTRAKRRGFLGIIDKFFGHFDDNKKKEQTEDNKSDTEAQDVQNQSEAAEASQEQTDADVGNNEDAAAEIKIPEWDGGTDKDADAKDIPEFILDDLCEKDSPDELVVADGVLDDFEGIDGLWELPQTRYRKSCFLKFGFDEIDSRVVIEELKGYLTARGCGVSGYEVRKERKGNEIETHRIVITNNPLMNARNRAADPFKWLDDDAAEQDRLYCDCCGNPLSGVSYEQLSDGRTRCNDCVATAIEDVEKFQRLFIQHSELMQSYYQISFNKPIKVELADAKTIAKRSGQVFKPTSKMDARVVGFAQKKRDRYNLVIENGSPRLATIDTMIHEMTHIWQYLNWDDRRLQNYYGRQFREMRTLIYEGMAVWSSIQYLYLIGESSYAELQEQVMKRNLEAEIIRIIQSYLQNKGQWEIEDPYSFGFRFYSEEYPLARNMEPPKKSTFKNYPPLSERNLREWAWLVVLEYAEEHGIQL